MCGVVGFYNFSGAPADLGVVERMAETIRHRGPDGLHAVSKGSVGLGHVRLAILDLTEAGKQPMQTADGLFSIVYNGEVYNFAEIRRELVSLGYEFQSRTDTEVVLNAYREWGRKCVSRFNGMFAFCILDNVRQDLFFARDRYGIKPLYYGVFNKTLLFASEAKAFTVHPAFSAKLDLHAFTEYLTFQNILTERTFFDGVSVFPAGCTGVCSMSGDGTVEISRYWDFDFSESDYSCSQEEAKEELDFLFCQAVRRQLVSDVELGAYLSGGIDSGSITAVAAKELPCMKSFTCGFDLNSASGIELGFDEREQAEFLSYLFKTEHYEVILKSGDLERIMPRLAWHIEEPRIGQSYPNFFASKLASHFVKVVLSGSGGDEIFAGYPWRYYRALQCDGFEDYIDQYYTFWQRLIPNNKLRPLLAPVESETRHIWTRDVFRSVFGPHTSSPQTPAESINRSLYFEAKTFLHGLLMIEDKLSMAHGLESRVPFLDNDLVDFSQKLPVHFKLQNLTKNVLLNENEHSKPRKFYRKYKDGKYLLRSAMERHVPNRISTAAKKGFSGPDASWFRGESLKYVQDFLLSREARVWEYLDYSTGTELVNEHLSGVENRRLFIWSLLSIEWWLRTYL
ncbi:asparagine synthase (glutamine-hydrolyzing) [Maridesulfovibrio sp.]|uniref:asparagine synthase (glutamine-hydrolyzing) n=1 Tax=Maridesulfovibrio sp. TaxID=2795000 RepID=UPI0029C9DEF9|nr:asparagine synthase (glutamine-hydrolyzing) [Maridesulfovibrio sp.]